MARSIHLVTVRSSRAAASSTAFFKAGSKRKYTLAVRPVDIIVRTPYPNSCHT